MPRVPCAHALLAASVALWSVGGAGAQAPSHADPYQVGLGTPRLVTPQWVGTPGVEAVVVLSIDDMRDSGRYEAFLRPILDRLAEIDGRAPLSIFSNFVRPDDPQLQTWLREGVSLEVHTVAHPCPCLGKRGFPWARKTYEGCVDNLARIPHGRPVAFRMPCCDSMNSVSPRFFAEVFGRVTPAGHFLEIDSSVFQLFTAADPAIPRALLLDAEGRNRFEPYLPHRGADGRRNFVNVIENYPYPYVVGGLCWQLPCAVPSDWEAQRRRGVNHPASVADMQAAIDITVARQGVYTLVFHPHGWIESRQVVALIDHVVRRHGSKVLFLNMREVRDRLTRHLLGGHPLRAADGSSHGVRLVDFDADGYRDVLIDHPSRRQTRHWHPVQRRWQVVEAPAEWAGRSLHPGRFGPAGVGASGAGTAGAGTAVLACTGDGVGRVWRWRDGGWRGDVPCTGLPADVTDCLPRDLDRDGTDELVIANARVQAVYRLDPAGRRWRRLAVLPSTTRLAALRCVDVDRDGRDDLVVSDQDRFGVLASAGRRDGYRAVFERRDGEGFEWPEFAVDGANQGAWFADGALFVQNERTGDAAPFHVARVPLARLAAWVQGRIAAAARRHPGGGAPLRVGAARVDITPTQPIRLAGYAARQAETARIAQRLSAKALVLGPDGAAAGELAALVTVDNCGVPAPVVEAVAGRLAKSLGLRRDRFVVTSTHTHSAPALRGYAPMLFDGPLPPDQQGRIDAYTDRLIGQLVEVVERAARQRVPGRLAWGQGQVRFAANRRVVRNSRWTGFGVQPGGPVDHDLPVLRVTDAAGKLLAVVANYACHCTGAGLEDGVCGDWAGFAQEYIEADHPGAVAMITIGCGADANPRPRGTLASVQTNGRAIATEVSRLLAGNLTPVGPALTTRMRRVRLPFSALPDRAYWQGRAGLAGSQGYHARTNLARLERGESLPTGLDYPIATWSFGDDLLMVFLAGEVVVDYATALQRVLDSRRIWITGWANDVPCYIPSQRILQEGGYEADGSMVYYDKPARFAPAVEPIILQAVQELAPAGYRSDNPAADTPSPRSPAEALAAMTLAEELRIELVAAEPLVVDPVAFDWGPDGRLWVVEMRDYPLRGPGVPGGRVKVLRDRDGDGRYDDATVFLDDLPYPTGVKVWRRGILVTAAPDILYAEDTDGDGRADLRTTLFTGFGEGNQQHRVNGLRWRLDNWLQVANGDSGGRIRSTRTGAAVDVRGRDLRIDADRGRLDPQSGQTQFGTARDDWGNWFGGDNSRPLWHYVLADHYVRRNPHVAPPPARRVLIGSVPVFPTSRTLERFNDLYAANRFTSACSPMIYRDSWLGSGFAGDFFVCEPVHNLVHRQRLTVDGTSFRAARPADRPGAEFVSSSDSWFRPAMVRTGPDGAIWIADMYRFVIEHPKWIPPRWQRILDLRAGADRGRIYRVFPKRSGRRPVPRLDRLDSAGLVAALDTPNGWQRDMVQQLLVWRSDPAVGPALGEVVRSHPRALTRLHALYALAGVQGLAPATLVAALADDHPGIRRHAVRLAESQLAAAPAVAAAVLARVADPDRQVRMQLAYSLGEWRDPRAGDALARLARQDATDPLLRAAILSSAVPHVDRLLVAMLDRQTADPVRRQLVGPLLATAAAAAEPAALQRVARVVAGVDAAESVPPAWRFGAVAQLLDAVPDQAAGVAAAVGGLCAAARRLVADAAAAAELRAAATGVLGRQSAQRAADLDLLIGQLAPRVPIEVQLAALRAVGRVAATDTPARLLPGWSGHSPRVRQGILDLLLGRRAFAAALLDHAARHPAFARQIDTARRARLMGHRDPAVQRAARDLFGRAATSERAAVVADYAAQLRRLGRDAGDAGRGRGVFLKHCAVCHRLQGAGNAVGPDLAALTDRSPQSLLVAVLDPNRAVEARYTNFLAELRDGRTVVGVISEESGASVTLHGLDGQPTVIPRQAIRRIDSSGVSMMPVGFEASIGAGAMADLLRYLRALGPPPKSFPGNRPELVQPGADGVIVLAAGQAAIHGTRLIFEPKYRNLGWWQRADDHAIWTVETPRAGRYRVRFDFACQRSDAGNSFLLTAGTERLTGKVPSTGTWDDYVEREFGEIQLQGGVEDIVIRPVGDPRGALLDLRAVRLVPSGSK